MRIVQELCNSKPSAIRQMRQAIGGDLGKIVVATSTVGKLRPRSIAAWAKTAWLAGANSVNA